MSDQRAEEPRRILCAHADRNGEGAHWKNAGEPCPLDRPRAAEPRTRWRWKIEVKWEPRDVWVGLYWTHPEEYVGSPPKMRSRKWFVCLVPCFPIIVTRWGRIR